MAIQIITDSTADLSSEQAQALGIQVIPLGVRFGEQEFIDGVTITKAEFYARLEEVEELPQTSQICPHAFEEAFAAARAEKGRPTAIIAKSIKGKDVSFMENQVGWHGKAPNDEQFEQAMAELTAAGEEL